MSTSARLTSLSHGGGCGCKLGPSDLREVVAKLPRPAHADLLVGIETSDDAAVWRLSPELAVVSTLDFFMPVVDDPFTFGQIAATNAISDVYAMGGTPLSALAIVGFPVGKLGNDVMARILEGGAAACAGAGIAIVGGHSIDDTEPKFGLSVTGVVHPDRIWRNSTAQDGDWLVLTKPLGVGTHASAVKKGVLPADAYDDLVRTTTTLNRAAAEAGHAVGVRTATDVTGFGLLGHASEIALGSGLTATLVISALPVLPHARALLEAGVVPGATRRTLAHYAADFADDVTEIDRLLIADPQTSGGLLFAVADPAPLVAALEARGALAAAVVGRLGPRGAAPVVVRARP